MLFEMHKSGHFSIVRRRRHFRHALDRVIMSLLSRLVINNLQVPFYLFQIVLALCSLLIKIQLFDMDRQNDKSLMCFMLVLKKF